MSIKYVYAGTVHFVATLLIKLIWSFFRNHHCLSMQKVVPRQKCAVPSLGGSEIQGERSWGDG